MERKTQAEFLNSERDVAIELEELSHTYFINVAGEIEIFSHRMSSGTSEAMKFGKTAHRIIEMYLRNRETPLLLQQVWQATGSLDSGIYTFRNLEQIFQNFIDYEQEINQQYELIASEYMVWGNMNGKLWAGTIDAIFWSNQVKREVVVMDWTTTRDFKITYNGRKNLDSKFCQLHKYMYILEQNYRVKVVKAFVVQVTTENCESYEVKNFDTCVCYRQ